VDGLRGTKAEAAPPPPIARIARISRPRVELQDSAPEAPVSETPAMTGGTSAARLARALGTEVVIDADGNQTVEAPPYVPFSTAPRTISRAEPSATSDAHTPASTTPPSEPASPAKPSEVDVDALADTVIEKLRRELLTERERSGAPMDLI
jgi:hypothetical protein